MRLFLDQMFRVEVAAHLRLMGYDVTQASDVGLSRADDAEILARAISENRVLLTLDGHFGNWAVLPLTGHTGVIRLRVDPTTTQNVLRLLCPFLAAHDRRCFANHLVIVTHARVRWIRTAE